MKEALKIRTPGVETEEVSTDEYRNSLLDGVIEAMEGYFYAGDWRTRGQVDVILASLLLLKERINSEEGKLVANTEDGKELAKIKNWKMSVRKLKEQRTSA